jgi:hypothetical protein
MAFGQIDPARLEGEALRRWYLRSPAEIEEEQRKATARKYQAFFSPLGDQQSSEPNSPEPGGSPSNNSGTTLERVDDRHWQGHRGGKAAQQAPDRYQLTAAAAPRRFWDYWGFRGCQNCHGYTPSTLPPYGGHSPIPPSNSPRSGGGSGGGSDAEGSRGKSPKQCAVQYENDSDICRSLNSPASRGRCWESAAERQAYCIRSKGEVGYPPLRR